MKKEAVDSAGQPEDENITDDSQDMLGYYKSENQELKATLQDLKGEVEKLQSEAKNAFKKRDELKDQVRGQKDWEATLERIQSERDDFEAQLTNIKQEAEKTQKLEAFKRVAKKHGFKEGYLDKIDKFVDISTLNPEKEISLNIAVESVKSEFPDLFGANSKTVDGALPNRKLGAGTLKDQHDDLWAKIQSTPSHLRKQEDIVRVAELREMIGAVDSDASGGRQ